MGILFRQARRAAIVVPGHFLRFSHAGPADPIERIRHASNRRVEVRTAQSSLDRPFSPDQGRATRPAVSRQTRSW
jgi:hypothetical protein